MHGDGADDNAEAEAEVVEVSDAELSEVVSWLAAPQLLLLQGRNSARSMHFTVVRGGASNQANDTTTSWDTFELQWSRESSPTVRVRARSLSLSLSLSLSSPAPAPALTLSMLHVRAHAHMLTHAHAHAHLSLPLRAARFSQDGFVRIVDIESFAEGASGVFTVSVGAFNPAAVRNSAGLRDITIRFPTEEQSLWYRQALELLHQRASE